MEIIKSFRYALKGIWHILKVERNARVHLVVAAVVLAAAFYLDVSPGEMAAICFAIILVFLAEVVNTAIEKTLDLIEPEHNGKVAIVKDMAAGAVLITSVGAVIIGVVVFRPYILDWLWRVR